MPRLADSLLAEGRREAVVTELATLIDNYVEALKGLKGMALRTAFNMLKGNDPHAVHGAMGKLMPDFLNGLEPLYQDFLKNKGKDFGAFMNAHPREALGALIGVTDARVERSSNGTLKSVYKKVRGTIESELKGVLPALSAVIAKHLHNN
jgi:hypothetical protein